MPAPGILTGGNTNFFTVNPSPSNAKDRQGIFGTFPGATPKYALNRGTRDAEYSDTVARLFIELPPTLSKQEFLNSLPPETRPLGEVLAVGGASGGSPGTGFIDFIMTTAQEGFQEKEQIVNTLTDNYVAFYAGQEAPVFQYSGTVFNTYQDDQRVWMLRLYRDILRGTRLAQRNLIASLRYDSFIVRGYLNSFGTSIESSTQMSGRFQFTMRVKEMVIHTPALAMPTMSNKLSAGVIPRQTSVGQKTDVVRVASLTINPPTAIKQPAAETSSGDYVPNAGIQDATNFTPVDPMAFSIQQAFLKPPPLDEKQQFLADLKANNLASYFTNPDSVNFTPVTGNSENVTNDGLGGTSNVKNASSDTLQNMSIDTTVPNRNRGLSSLMSESDNASSNNP